MSPSEPVLFPRSNLKAAASIRSAVKVTWSWARSKLRSFNASWMPGNASAAYPRSMPGACSICLNHGRPGRPVSNQSGSDFYRLATSWYSHQRTHKVQVPCDSETIVWLVNLFFCSFPLFLLWHWRVCHLLLLFCLRYSIELIPRIITLERECWGTDRNIRVTYRVTHKGLMSHEYCFPRAAVSPPSYTFSVKAFY